MAVNGLGTYNASYYQSMYSAKSTKNLLSGMNKSVYSSSDPLSSIYNNLSNSALYKTTGYRSLVNAYCKKQMANLEAETEENLSKIEGKETEISEEEKAEETLNNLSYNASGVVFGENSDSSGMFLNMQI